MPALQIGLEAWLVLALVGRVRALVRTRGNVDEALASELTTRFGKLAPAFLFEARAWYYGLFLRDGAALRFRGDRHFTYHANQGNASTQAAFIFVLLIELPLVHLLLHFVAPAPWMAWAADGLQLWTLLYLVAEYHALAPGVAGRRDTAAALRRAGGGPGDPAVQHRRDRPLRQRRAPPARRHTAAAVRRAERSADLAGRHTAARLARAIAAGAPDLPGPG
ncbi:hypothetical protein E7V67_007680 [[Empedobacter] haloabium]|uniref:Uncharacterized protein n=1 Tax=[Empedobacter] haloabium TaxID=592317 RepID=A0ABZ1UQM1_9BURK